LQAGGVGAEVGVGVGVGAAVAVGAAVGVGVGIAVGAGVGVGFGPGVGVDVGGCRGPIVGAGVVPVGGGVGVPPIEPTPPGWVVAWEPPGDTPAVAVAAGSVVGRVDVVPPADGVAPLVADGGT
jgi:hypothetical protein